MYELDPIAVDMLNLQIENRKELTPYGSTDTSLLNSYIQGVLQVGAQTAKLNTKIAERIELPTATGIAVAIIQHSTQEYLLTIPNPQGETIVILNSIPVDVQGILLTSQSVLMWYATAIKARIDETPLMPGESHNIGELFNRLDNYTDPIEGYIDSDGQIRISLMVDTPGLILRDKQIWITDSSIMEFDLMGQSSDRYAIHVILDWGVGIINLFGMQLNATQRRFMPLCAWSLSPIGSNQEEEIIKRLYTEYNLSNGFRVGDTSG